MANTTAPLSYDQIRSALTADQWYGIITGDDDGLLAVCCAEISALRDDMADFLRSPNAISAAGVAAAIAEGSHEFGPELARFAQLLIAQLDTRDGDWRRFNDDDTAAMEYFDACITFARGTVSGPQPNGDNWHQSFNATISMLTEPIDVEQIIRFREHGKVALAAGAPPAALLAADVCALALYRASTRTTGQDGDATGVATTEGS